MNKDDIIRMAKESGVVSEAYDAGFMNLFTSKLIRFAALVASAERESLRESFRVVTAAEASAAILHEREACAKVCDEVAEYFPSSGFVGSFIARKIRDRGQA